jgi:hypothetical protein
MYEAQAASLGGSACPNLSRYLRNDGTLLDSGKVLDPSPKKAPGMTMAYNISYKQINNYRQI